MHTIGRRLAGAGLLLVSAAGAVGAQTAAAPATSPAPPAAYLSLNAGAQVLPETFEPSWTFPLYREQARVEALYDAPAALALDVGGGVRLWRGLAAGAALTRTQTKSAAGVTGTLPHPLVLSGTRELDASVPDLERVEMAVHLHLGWLAPVDDRVSIAVFGGPTIVRLEQDVITGLNLTEAYPYDVVELGSATRARQQETAVGFHAGADVMYRIRRQVGVGALARYSRATATITVGGDGRSDVTAGGLQLTAGLRWVF